MGTDAKVTLQVMVDDFAKPDYEKKVWVGKPTVTVAGRAVKTQTGVGMPHVPVTFVLDGKIEQIRADAQGRFSKVLVFPLQEAKSHIVGATYRDPKGQAMAQVKFGCYQVYCATFAPPPYQGSVSVIRGQVVLYQGLSKEDFMPGCTMWVASLLIPIVAGRPLTIAYRNDTPVQIPNGFCWHYFSLDGQWVRRYPAISGILRMNIP